MRFIIIKEEFFNGKLTTQLPLAVFATEDETLARREFEKFFALGLRRWRKRFTDLTEARASDVLVATADGGRRKIRFKLLDALAKRPRRKRS